MIQKKLSSLSVILVIILLISGCDGLFTPDGLFKIEVHYPLGPLASRAVEGATIEGG